MKTLIVGAAIVDQMMWLDRLPTSGDDVLCKQTKTVIGGCAFNVASTMRNIDAEHDLCVPVGKGMYASLIKKGLEQNDYPILIRDNSEDNGYCLSLIENNGERTFITVQGVEGHFRKEWFSPIDMRQYSSIYLAGYQIVGKSGEEITDWLTGYPDKTIYFAPGPMITVIEKTVIDRIFNLHPVLHINDKEAIDFTGETDVEAAARTIYQQTENVVIITLGSKGCLCFDGEKIHQIPSQKASVVSTVGAGDSHIGAVMSFISLGQDLDQALENANIVSGGIVGIEGPTMSKEYFDQNIRGKMVWNG